MDSGPSSPFPIHNNYPEIGLLASLQVPHNRLGEHPIQMYPSQPSIVFEPIQPDFHRRVGSGCSTYVAPVLARDGPQMSRLPNHGFPGNNLKELQRPRNHSVVHPIQAESRGRGFSSKTTGAVRVPALLQDPNFRVAQFYSGPSYPIPYHLVEPLQPAAQGIAWDTSKPLGGLSLPHSKVPDDNRILPSNYQNYHYPDHRGFMPPNPGLGIQRASPRPNEYSPLSLPKPREVQKHEWRQNRAHAQEGYLGQITNLGQSQGWEQQQSQIGAAEKRPPMAFSNDARVMEHHDVNRRYGSLDESKGVRQHQDLPQQTYRSNRRNSRGSGSGSGSRRPSVSHHSPNEQNQTYHSHGAFSPVIYGSARGSGDYTGYVMHKIDENQPYDSFSNDKAIETKADDATDRYDDRKRHPAFSAQPVASQITSHVAYPDQPNQSSSVNASHSQAAPSGDPRKLYVCAFDITREDLNRLFTPFGPILEIVEPRILKPSNTATPHTLKSVSFVT